MSRATKNERLFISPPGDDILEHINYIRMSQAELADRLNKTTSKVNDLIKGKEPITYVTALQLERVLGVEAKYWLNREMNYREKLMRVEQKEALEGAAVWVQQHPIAELKKFGYIKSNTSGPDLAAALFEFYGVANIQTWKNMYVEEFASAAYRRSSIHRTSLASMASWLRMGEIEMQKNKLPDFDKAKFRKVLKDVKTLIPTQPSNFTVQLQEMCATAGVGLMYTICLPKAPVSGATRWFRSNPIIQLTDRYKTNDRFWFSFFHEAGHVVLHPRKQMFLEEYKGFKPIKQKEDEANEFAMKQLLPEHATAQLPANFTNGHIIRLAKQFETHPGIVVGRLQWEGRLGYHEGNGLKSPVVI